MYSKDYIIRLDIVSNMSTRYEMGFSPTQAMHNLLKDVIRTNFDKYASIWTSKGKNAVYNALAFDLHEYFEDMIHLCVGHRRAIDGNKKYARWLHECIGYRWYVLNQDANECTLKSPLAKKRLYLKALRKHLFEQL